MEVAIAVPKASFQVRGLKLTGFVLGHLRLIPVGINDGRVRVRLACVQQRFDVSSDYFWIIRIHIDSDIGVLLVKRHALVINIFERVIAGRRYAAVGS